MQELNNVQDHLRFLNRHPATAVSIVMINFGTMAITGWDIHSHTEKRSVDFGNLARLRGSYPLSYRLFHIKEYQFRRRSASLLISFF